MIKEVKLDNPFSEPITARIAKICTTCLGCVARANVDGSLYFIRKAIMARTQQPDLIPIDFYQAVNKNEIPDSCTKIGIHATRLREGCLFEIELR